MFIILHLSIWCFIYHQLYISYCYVNSLVLYLGTFSALEFIPFCTLYVVVGNPSTDRIISEKVLGYDMDILHYIWTNLTLFLLCLAYINSLLQVHLKHVNRTTMHLVYRKAGPTLSRLTSNGSASRSSPRKINSRILWRTGITHPLYRQASRSPKFPSTSSETSSCGCPSTCGK